MIKDAVISECGKYRYQLLREWDAKLSKILFIMLNPSTANAQEDDPTIRRCIGFAKSWGYGGIYVGNLFAYRSTNPKELLKSSDPIGPNNFDNIKIMANKCEYMVMAYGNGNKEMPYSPILLTLLIENYNVVHIGPLTKQGNPRHPLYIKGSEQLAMY